jgi:hypothetical protein
MKRFCCCCCTRAAVVSFQAAGKCGTAQVREVATERSGGTTRARATLSPSLKLKLSRIFLCVPLVRVSVRRVGARAGGVCRWRTRGAAPLPAAHGHARRAPRAPGSSAGGFGPPWTAAGCLGPPQTPAGGWPLSHRTPPNAAALPGPPHPRRRQPRRARGGAQLARTQGSAAWPTPCPPWTGRRGGTVRARRRAC